MRAVVTRVRRAAVSIDGEMVARIGKGFLVLLGVHVSDGPAQAEKIADRICGLRVFEDEGGKMNIAPGDVGAELLIVSQFTLYGDTKKGFRPSFIHAAKAPLSVDAYELFLAEMNKQGLKEVQHGEFGADMQVSLVNEGPCTIVIDTDEWKKKD